MMVQVFPFGSVPLKTYLPDGDIDLTALVGSNLEDALASDVCSVLNREEQNGAAQFVVKDVQLIRAEVLALNILFFSKLFYLQTMQTFLVTTNELKTSLLTVDV